MPHIGLPRGRFDPPHGYIPAARRAARKEVNTEGRARGKSTEDGPERPASVAREGGNGISVPPARSPPTFAPLTPGYQLPALRAEEHRACRRASNLGGTGKVSGFLVPPACQLSALSG